MIFEDDEELGELLEHAMGDEAVAAACAGHRRRLAALVRHLRRARGQGPQGKKQKPEVFSWEAHVARLTEAQFKRRYRLTWESFNKLLRVVSADLDIVNVEQAKRGRNGRVVSNAVKLAIGLRYMAGGDPQDLFLIYRVSLPYVYKCVLFGLSTPFG